MATPNGAFHTPSNDEAAFVAVTVATATAEEATSDVPLMHPPSGLHPTPLVQQLPSSQGMELLLVVILVDLRDKRLRHVLTLDSTILERRRLLLHDSILLYRRDDP